MARLVVLSTPGRFPPLAKQAANFVSAVGRVASAAAAGSQVLVVDDERARRAAACAACEHHSDGRCTLCGCCSGTWRLVLDKTKYATERCPATPPRW